LITVDDDGPGIRPDAIEKIFERFYTDRPQQNFGQNSGLGLSISKQIVEAHDGRLSAQNRVAPREPGHDAEGDDLVLEERILGARFVVRLPAM
jgi:two-component system sensor histidine kinase ChvG